MANINTLSDAAEYLAMTLSNELELNSSFSDSEVSELAHLIVKVFSDFEKEVNGYEDNK